MRWIPTLYFVQGLQFFVVMLIAGLMFKQMGVANDQIARWTGLIGLAWAFKPLWSPLVELARSKKAVVVAMQFSGAAGLGLLALALQASAFFALSIAVLFFLAYASATHDIACDGLYMGALDEKRQAAYAGWQGAFFNASKFLTLGGLMVLAGRLETRMGVFNAWSLIFALLAVLLALLAAWNAKALPNPERAAAEPVKLPEIVADFLKKPGIWKMVVFIVLFRLAEGQVQTIGPLFLIEARDKGGLGLTSEQVGGVYGTVGTAAFLFPLWWMLSVSLMTPDAAQAATVSATGAASARSDARRRDLTMRMASAQWVRQVQVSAKSRIVWIRSMCTSLHSLSLWQALEVSLLPTKRYSPSCATICARRSTLSHCLWHLWWAT